MTKLLDAVRVHRRLMDTSGELKTIKVGDTEFQFGGKTLAEIVEASMVSVADHDPTAGLKTHSVSRRLL
jgi:hypothetical protein